MTDLPVASPPRKLGLVIDLDTCVGCHACAVACKQWNTGGIKGPLTDENAYGREPFGVWLNRVHSYEIDDYRPQDSAGQPEAPSVEHRHSREGGNPVPLPSKSLAPRAASA